MLNVSIKTKLLVMVLIPLLGMFIAISNIVFEKHKKVEEILVLEDYFLHSQHTLKLISSLQEERALMSKFKLFKKDEYKTQLEMLRPKTDALYKRFNALISDKNITIKSSEFSKLYNQRKSSHSYNQLVTFLNDTIIAKFSIISNIKEISQENSTVATLLKIKEKALLENSLLEKFFHTNSITPTDFNNFGFLVNDQKNRLEALSGLINKEQKNDLEKIKKSRSFQKVSQIREIVIGKVQKDEILTKLQQEIGFGGLIQLFNDFALNGDEENLIKFDEKYSLFLELLEEFSDNAFITPDEEEMLDIIEAVFSEYKDLLDEIVELKESEASLEEITNAMKIDGSEALIAIKELSSNIQGIDNKEWNEVSIQRIEHFTQLEEHLVKKLKQTINHTLTSENNLFWFFTVLAVVILLATLLITFITTRNIIKEITLFENGILDFFEYLNKKKANVKPLDTNVSKEIARIAETINENIVKTQQTIENDERFIQDVSIMIDEINKGYLYKRFETPIESENLEKLRVKMNLMLENLNSIVGGSTNKILDVLTSFANLDFTNSIRNDNGKIPITLNNVAKLITEMLVENKSTGLKLEKTSHTLLENVDLLNNNSSETAAALEETAAALEEVTGNIRNNTENIGSMASYADKLSTASIQGEKLAKETTVAMDEINEQVEHINEAIAIIDKIAFQTNILSLNAAVEAATAGEAGKGFAVVAQEVRNLASRSAEAAKEIKDLVEDANRKTNEGKNISQDMITGYNNLNENISQTIDLISDVKSASVEQLNGIEQINDAIGELDQKTQKNVAIAHNANEIAIKTDEFAKVIVERADEIKFNGKDEIN